MVGKGVEPTIENIKAQKIGYQYVKSILDSLIAEANEQFESHKKEIILKKENVSLVAKTSQVNIIKSLYYKIIKHYQKTIRETNVIFIPREEKQNEVDVPFYQHKVQSIKIEIKSHDVCGVEDTFLDVSLLGFTPIKEFIKELIYDGDDYCKIMNRLHVKEEYKEEELLSLQPTKKVKFKIKGKKMEIKILTHLFPQTREQFASDNTSLSAFCGGELLRYFNKKGLFTVGDYMRYTMDANKRNTILHKGMKLRREGNNSYKEFRSKILDYVNVCLAKQKIEKFGANGSSIFNEKLIDQPKLVEETITLKDINDLFKFPASDFKRNSSQMKKISSAVETYLKNVKKHMMKLGYSNSEVMSGIQNLIESYHTIVDEKRLELNGGAEIDAMITKGVKYKRKTAPNSLLGRVKMREKTDDFEVNP